METKACAQMGKNDINWDAACELVKANKNRKGPEDVIFVQDMASNQLFVCIRLNFLVHNYGSEDKSLPGTNDENESGESQKSFLINKHQIIAAYWMLLTEANGCRGGMESDEMGYGKEYYLCSVSG